MLQIYDKKLVSESVLGFFNLWGLEKNLDVIMTTDVFLTVVDIWKVGVTGVHGQTHLDFIVYLNLFEDYSVLLKHFSSFLGLFGFLVSPHHNFSMLKFIDNVRFNHVDFFISELTIAGRKVSLFHLGLV